MGKRYSWTAEVHTGHAENRRDTYQGHVDAPAEATTKDAESAAHSWLRGQGVRGAIFVNAKEGE
ncbi:hypothetical protein [Streptomyces cacaoi]|uniref:hypothetical protein n=1 Tax=Streptomyces cacaoi TaxID=1898 RepID=UPI0026378B46|nr:hypothetical protein [Streptomyces cacaoi]